LIKVAGGAREEPGEGLASTKTARAAALAHEGIRISLLPLTFLKQERVNLQAGNQKCKRIGIAHEHNMVK
jgi:hypothetical protein